MPYEESWAAMKHFVKGRNAETSDELWVLEHQPVFTLGQAADPTHVLRLGTIPIVKSDRGGQVTYHGPGQIMFYALINIARLGLSVRRYVELLELSIIDMLDGYGIEALGDRDAPGVYVAGAKIAALGLRVSRGSTYHGLCFNYDFDAAPFRDINPCGYSDMQISQLQLLMAEQGAALPSRAQLLSDFLVAMQRRFGFAELSRDCTTWRNNKQENIN